MRTAMDYRREAQRCQELAERTNEPDLRAALTDLSREYMRAARQTERRERDLKTVAHLQAERS